MGYFLKNRQLQSGSISVVVPAGTTGQLPTHPVVGTISFNTTNNFLQVYNGSSWQTLSTVTYVIDNFTGNGSTTAFTMSQAPASASQIMVFISGIYQTPTSSYTVTGTTITFSNAPPVSSINVIHTNG